MQAKALQWKRVTQMALIVLSIILMGMTSTCVYAEEKATWDWWETSPSNTRLYYKVIDATNHKVAVVYPSENPSDPYNGYIKPSGNIIIPDTVTHNGVSYAVTEIGANAFFNCNSITGSLVIPNTVTTIGNSAFSFCTGFNGTLTIGNSVTRIGLRAFYSCRFIGDLVIPNSVTILMTNAFEGCEYFNGTLTLSNSLTYIGGYVFYGCNGFTGTLTIPESVTTIYDFAFYNCSGFQELILPKNLRLIKESAFEGCSGLTGDLVIPSKVDDIFEGAFYNCNSFNSIYVCREIPPVIYASNVFSVSTSLPVYVPYCAIDNYSSATGWSRFSNYQGCNFFIEDGDWSDADNWTCGLPEEEENVIIDANCNMNLVSGSIASVDIFKRSNLSIASGAALTVNNTITNNGTASNLVVEYGGQLKYNGSVAATLQRDILAYSSTRDKYYFIASPMTENLNAATDVNGMITESAYDLYMFDQECADDDLEWRNYEANMFEDIVPTVGYLYANQEGTTIEFAGTTAPSGTEINVELAYTAGRPFTGYNLIGNPFICEAFVDRDFLVLNDNGDNFVNGSTIMPGDAIMVQADEEWQSATFTTTPGSKNDSYIELSIVKNTNRECSGLIDNARIRFGEGRGMDKLYLNASSTNIYIPENGKKRAVAYAADKNEMPVNFKAETDGTYTISADLLNVESDYLHLIDNLTGNDIDLKTMPVYTFEAKVTDYASRFRLMFAPANTNENEENFAFMSNGALVIDNMYEGVLQVVDVTGRILSSEVINGNYNKSLNLSAGVYVLRLVNNNNVKTQKIIVE